MVTIFNQTKIQLHHPNPDILVNLAVVHHTHYTVPAAVQ